MLLVALAAITLAVTAAADDLVWDLLTDAEAGYRIEDRQDSYSLLEEEDGTPYMVNRKKGALYIYDDNNILGTCNSGVLNGAGHHQKGRLGNIHVHAVAEAGIVRVMERSMGLYAGQTDLIQ